MSVFCVCLSPCSDFHWRIRSVFNARPPEEHLNHSALVFKSCSFCKNFFERFFLKILWIESNKIPEVVKVISCLETLFSNCCNKHPSSLWQSGQLLPILTSERLFGMFFKTECYHLITFFLFVYRPLKATDTITIAKKWCRNAFTHKTLGHRKNLLVSTNAILDNTTSIEASRQKCRAAASMLRWLLRMLRHSSESWSSFWHQLEPKQQQDL